MSGFDDADDEFHDCVEGLANVEVSSPVREFRETINDQIVSEVKADDDVEEIPRGFAIEKNLDLATQAKEEGNEYFRRKEYDFAIQQYSLAISRCPEDQTEQLATFYGNRSAAYFAEEDYELVIDDCGAALELKADYAKVIVRRMQAYEKLDKLEEALADAKRIQELDPAYPKINITVARLQRLYDEKMSKLKDEAMGKLKDLGNSILGNFGMSLDNFKMTQDPQTGGWSISMNK